MSDFVPTARIIECTEKEYFADPCEVPSLSHSIAHKMLSRSPFHGWSEHPKLGGAPEQDEIEDDDEEPSDDMKQGQLVHKLLLGKGVDVAVIEADSFRTKIAKQLRDEAKAEGKLPILAHKYKAMQSVGNLLRGRCAAAGYALNGESEVAIEWTEPGQNGPVVCRCRIDHLLLDDGLILDVKKSRNAHPSKSERNFVEYGYDIQYAAYTRAVEALRRDLVGKTRFRFLYVETTPPYAVVPAIPGGAFREIGRQRWLQAVQLWERCLSTGEWPSYCDHAVTLEAPVYVVQQYLGNAS